MRLINSAILWLVLAVFTGLYAQGGLPPGWGVNPGDYQFNASVIAKVRLNNAALPAGNNILGAFAGSQARGNTTAINLGNERVFFLTVYANNSGEVIRFKVYIPSLDTITIVTDSIIFTPNGIYGSVSEPLIFNSYLTLDRPPVLNGIPDQKIYDGYTFTPFDLDNYVQELDGDSVVYSFTADTNLTVNIDNQNIVRIQPKYSGWIGSGAVLFTVRDITAAGLNSTDTAVYTITVNPLTAPSSLSGTAFRNPGRISLTWQDNTLLESKYIIERKTGDSASVQPFVVRDSVPFNSIQYVDTSIYALTLYTYRILAVNDTLRSKYSNYFSVTSLQDVQTVNAPDSLTAVRISSDKVRLWWLDRSDNELGFYIERKAGDSTSTNVYTLLATASANAVTFVDTLPPGDTTVYTYRVRAFNQDTVSGYSNQAVVFGIIPVELISFTARYETGKVKVTWETATETNNFGFTVQKSEKGGTWFNVKFISGHGTSLLHNLYEYDDYDIKPNGKYEYRLLQTDHDGSITYSPVIEVNTNFAAEQFELFQNYPNPFNPKTEIRYQLTEAGYIKLEIFDITGSRVLSAFEGYQTVGEYKYAVNLAGVNAGSGVFLYRLIMNGAVLAVKKMIMLK